MADRLTLGTPISAPGSRGWTLLRYFADYSGIRHFSPGLRAVAPGGVVAWEAWRRIDVARDTRRAEWCLKPAAQSRTSRRLHGDSVVDTDGSRAVAAHHRPTVARRSLVVCARPLLRTRFAPLRYRQSTDRAASHRGS